ncbi:MAG: hemerythrin domain-containing protein [Bacteroidales bacterium]|nr:hemerythrin domain-containing protein [Bacteroidales bacterium]
MIITKTFKMAELIHDNFELLSVLRKFNIPLGFSEKTVDEVCAEHRINTDFFLEIVNSFNDSEYFPQNKMRAHDVEDILFYLRNTHKIYLNKKVPEIADLIEKLEFPKDHEKNKALLKNFFNEYRQEFILHIQREEERIYPYITALSDALRNYKTDAAFYNNIQQYVIADYQKEHEDVEEKLYDLKNIIIKYLPVPENAETYNAILIKLFKLEKDLNEHSRIEENVIIPKVSEMENVFFEAVKDGKMLIV